MLYSIKKLPQGKDSTGWIKLKAEVKDNKATVAQVKLSLSLSSSMQKGYLFLLDLHKKEALFYQSVETIGDLNPVFNKSDSTPFTFEGDVVVQEKEVLLQTKENKEPLFCVSPAVTTPNSNPPLVAVTVADKRDKEASSLLGCTLSTNPAHYLEFPIDGPNWKGKIVLISKVPVWKIEVKREVGGQHVPIALAEWRNFRDVKLEVLLPNEDVAFLLALLIAIRRIQASMSTTSLYF